MSATDQSAAFAGGTPRQRRNTDLGLTVRLLAYVVRQRRLFALSVLSYPLSALAVVLPPYLVQQVLDVAVPAADLGLLGWLGLAYVGAIALEYITGFGSQFVTSVLGDRAVKNLRAELFRHVQRLSARYYDHNPIGRTLTQLTNDVDALAEMFATGAVTVLGDLVTVAGIVAAMLLLDVRLTLYSFLVVPPLLLVTWVFRVYARRAFRAIRVHLSRINTFLAEHIGGMSVVQLFGQERRTQEEFAVLNRAYRDANQSAILFDALLFSVVEAIGVAAVAAMIWLGAVDLAGGAVGAGTLLAFIQYIRRLFVPVRDLSTKYTVLQSAYAAAERLFALRDEPIDVAAPADARRLPSLQRGLELRDVWFSYGDPSAGAPWVLRGLSLQVRRGERVALIGATGAGKTTVLDLLGRSYDIQRGSISVDGVELRQLDLADLRRLFAVVLQEVYLFSGSILDNLRSGGEVSAEAARRAAEAVQADAFIQRLPKGYDSIVQELGINFSTGERQLLAFARALARDPQVLVLDEATSNVDADTEARIQGALDVLLQSRTAIVVAHRLSTVRKMDRIVVVQEGQVVEEGDHAALLAQGGVYHRLVQLQLDGGSGRVLEPLRSDV